MCPVLRDSLEQQSVVADLCVFIFVCFTVNLLVHVTCMYEVHLCDFCSFVIRISSQFCDEVFIDSMVIKCCEKFARV